MESGFVGGVYALGPRVPPARKRDAANTVTSTPGFRVPSRILAARAQTTTADCSDPSACEKPVGGSSLTLPIALGVCIPVAVIVGVLLYLHQRSVRKQRREDLNDPHKSLDFGLGQGGATKGSRKSLISREKDGQSRFNRQQMSMDMNLSSPYLLPPELHTSRESFNSLAKTIHQAEDPYRPVAQYAGSDVGSIRSVRRGPDATSVYTRSESRADASPLSPGLYGSPPRQNLARSPLHPPEPSHMKPEPPLPEEPGMFPPAAPPKGPLPAIGTARSASPRGENEYLASGTAIQEPPAVAQKSPSKPLPSPSQPSPADSGVGLGYGEMGNPFEKAGAKQLETPTEPSAVGLGFSNHAEPQRASIRTSTSSYDSRATSPGPYRGQPASTTAPIIEEPEPLDYYDFDFADMPEIPRDQRSPSPANRNGNLEVDDQRGRNMQRNSHLFEQQSAARQSGLGVPQQDNRRLSVGFRPLPPDEIMETEDPEYRANRIRSFYKEYFEDTKPEDRPPMPQMGQQQQQPQQQQQYQQYSQHQQYPQHQHHQSNTSYYEDYDPSYAQDAPYFDPASNSFVMPYSQPVSRRAMTPPPSGQRFPGPRGPPRAFHGSQTSMRYPQNLRGPPRPGSSVSNQMGGQSRPGSSASGAYGPRPRAGSAMSGSRSGSRFGGPRKPMPPPSDLPTLPTPSKLRDDSFALFNAADFAPPETFADRARGRSQSPSGERRPYKMNVPVHSPLVTAYEELPVLPSPHLLRTNESTFTGLDFAPPRKFADADNQSDAGSIRSNRSGLSAAQANAIRGGAGRVSRLPGDQVFTQAVMSKTLKPQWGMRD